MLAFLLALGEWFLFRLELITRSLPEIREQRATGIGLVISGAFLIEFVIAITVLTTINAVLFDSYYRLRAP